MWSSKGSNPWLTTLLVIFSAIIFAASVINHQIQWKVSPGITFLDTLQQLQSSNDFYYLFTADTQYYTRCSPENNLCLQATNNCDGNAATCQRQQGTHTTRLQSISMRSLISKMALKNVRTKGIIVNGDLTEFGQDEELQAYRRYWTGSVDGVKVYPGLGNHDYRNNINKCNSCAVRMLNFFSQLIQKEVMQPVDLVKQQVVATTKYQGSLSYSWDECDPISKRCIHFVQLNYHPAYQTTVASGQEEWIIVPSFDWLEKDLAANYQTKPFVLNMHDFGSLSTQSRKRLIDILSKPGYRTLAITFGHEHSLVGSHPTGYLCINGKPVSLFYAGSVPGNNYMMLRFNPTVTTLRSAYAFHVESETLTSVREIPIQSTC